MLFCYLFRNPAFWIVPLLIQIVSYWKILKKMGKNPVFAVLPVAGEMVMSQDLFRRMRSFFRPAVATFMLMLTAYYIRSSSEYSIMLKFLACIVYGIFLIRLYGRLAFRFGKGKAFALGLILFPLIFLPVLAFGKSTYLGKIDFPPEKERTRFSRMIRKAGLVLISVSEVLALAAFCFVITTMVYPLKPVVKNLQNYELERMADVDDANEQTGRAETLGQEYPALAEAQRSREYYCADSGDAEKVVVMTYIIGSDLEDTRGYASINIAQMKEATGKGDGLDFVVQAGGSARWFTDGMKDKSVGRYLIRGGELSKVGKLSSGTCMSEPENLKEFIVWSKEHYPADRYMLILWDHGGGFASGYGIDTLNERRGKTDLISASEIIHAVRDAGVTFDLIGFDACLMQNLEYANAFEPYADYYLASEETEPGNGWFYTAGFGKLAEDPGLDTEEFGRAMISSYDQLYRMQNDGEPDPANTLSLVDLTLVKPVYKQMEELYRKAAYEMPEKPYAFVNLSAARGKAYQFYDEEQVDLINYLEHLKKTDYREELITDEAIDEIITAAKTCVVYHNKDSAEGINGLAIDFPYGDLDYYNRGHKEYVAVKYDAEERFFNTFCSILASQKMKQQKQGGFLETLGQRDYTTEDWYMKGFEDYDTASLFIDIPLKEMPEGYLPVIPEKSRDTILDTTVGAYIVTDEGRMYIGKEHFGTYDAAGRPVIKMQGKWATINGHLICYESGQPMETDQGIVYQGTCKAVLNGNTDITIQLEWDPVMEGSDAEAEGRVMGYTTDIDAFSYMKKGLEQFRTGDKIDFMFDYYNEEGKLIGSEESGHPLRVTAQDRLTLKNEAFESGTELEYFGVLTDVYQRELHTESITEIIE